MSVCSALGNTLAALSPGRARRLLSPWAWGRLDELCSSQSSRLARPAMRCLCLAARAEGHLEPVLRHLRPALAVLVAAPEVETAGLLRAAWLAACACEFCDLDTVAKPSDLGLVASSLLLEGLKRRRLGGVGAAIARELLRVFQARFNDADSDEALPALLVALGFALRRFPQSAPEALAPVLGAEKPPLAERALEVLTGLCEHLEQGVAGGCAVLQKLTRHLPKALEAMRFGLFRRPQPGDAARRRAGLAAAKALQRAGSAGSKQLAEAAFTVLLGDRQLRAGLLLQTLARKEPQALPLALASGLREAFAALRWHHPQLLALGSSDPILARGAAGAAKAFALCGRAGRLKWLRTLLAELCGGLAPGVPVPDEAEARLLAGGKKRPFSPKKAQEAAAPAAPEALLYGHFVAQQLLALPLSAATPAGQAEITLITEETR
ncbi:unnamed protein product [Effrenium voratum]|uniref:Uncharacterized protein n=1 Tax=Effrenium voratum TaxID=2562239 RepID=A0AA36HX98_9DINO|nr:unnamed protein product [Effrenium voratum]